MGIGVKEDFLQQVVILVQHALGDTHVALERGARCILMLHHSSKHERRDKGDRQRIGHRLIVLLEGIFVDIQAQLLIEVLEEDTPHVVALADDDGILLGELLQIGEGRTEHRVRRYIAHTRRLVELLQIGLHRGDIADDTRLGQMGNHLLKHRNGIFQRHCVDQQLGLKRLDFLVGRKTLAIVCEPHAFGISLKHCHLMLKTQQVNEEASHLPCTHY